MYILTINYLDGTTDVSSHPTFNLVKESISSIEKLVDSLEVNYEVQSELPDIDETSHLSWGI